MRRAVLYAARDIRFEERETRRIMSLRTPSSGWRPPASVARTCGRARPGMKVICISGYTDDVALNSGLIDSGMAFLQKPITPEALGRKVREALSG